MSLAAFSAFLKQNEAFVTCLLAPVDEIQLYYCLEKSTCPLLYRLTKQKTSFFSTDETCTQGHELKLRQILEKVLRCEFYLAPNEG